MNFSDEDFKKFYQELERKRDDYMLPHPDFDYKMETCEDHILDCAFLISNFQRSFLDEIVKFAKEGDETLSNILKELFNQCDVLNDLIIRDIE